MAVMVWCQSCKKVVWAYDHFPHTDIRGFLNEAYMPCPRCGAEGNFDGWGDNGKDLNFFKGAHPNEPIYDWWSLMKAVAKNHNMEWCPSGDNRWFPRN